MVHSRLNLSNWPLRPVREVGRKCTIGCEKKLINFFEVYCVPKNLNEVCSVVSDGEACFVSDSKVVVNFGHVLGKDVERMSAGELLDRKARRMSFQRVLIQPMNSDSEKAAASTCPTVRSCAHTVNCLKDVYEILFPLLKACLELTCKSLSTPGSNPSSS